MKRIVIAVPAALAVTILAVAYPLPGLGWVLDTDRYPARWSCGSWAGWIGWLHIISDVMTWLAYLAIPAMLVFFARNRVEIPFRGLFWLFSLFIISCGTTHLMEALIFWWPAYGLSGILKLGTAVVSVGTAVALATVIPQALSLKSPAQLEVEVQRRTHELEESRRAARESEMKLEGVINNSANLVFLLRPDGTLLEANRTAMGTTGIEDRTVRQVPLWKSRWWSHSEEYHARLEQAVQSARSGQRDHFEATHRHTGGKLIDVAVSVQAIHDNDGGVVYLIAESQDITDHKRREAELERLNAKLELSNKELEQFAAVASHDLQEPLRKISSYADLLIEDSGDALTEDSRRYAATIVDGADRLRTLIGDLLALSRVKSHGKPLTQVDATECLKQALEDLEVAIQDSGAQITSDPLPLVTAESGQLVQVFENLLGNAIKYRGDREARIHIGGREDGAGYEFWVEDNGIGIEPRYSERVFEIFQRLHGRNKYSGTGIGLAICKKIVERFGGEIWVDPDRKEGSSFHFTLHASKGHTNHD